MKQAVLLLRGYIDTYAARNGFAYPAKGQVRKGGGLPAPVWPANPWTGRALAPGSGRGTYTYTVAADQGSYTLVGRLSSGSYKVSGGSPAWLATERATAAQQQTASKDAISELGARVIKGYIQEWGLLNNATAPPAAEVTPAGVGAGKDFWPSNPWSGMPMANSSATGDFAYAAGSASAYSLSAQRSTGPMSLDGSVPTQIRTALDGLRNESTKASVAYLQAVVDRYALENDDMFPSTLDKASTDPYFFDYWPRNPWTGMYMQAGMGPGDYTYTRALAPYGYTIAGHLADGSDFIVDDYWATRFLGLRDRLKNTCVQAHAQVLKAYVDNWKLAHGGTLPTVGEMTRGGAVGLAQTWWPANPWTNAPMTPGSSVGDFEFAPGAGGQFTVTVHQRAIPERYPGDPGAMPGTYTAQ